MPSNIQKWIPSQAGGSGLGKSSLSIRIGMTLTDEALMKKIQVLRAHTGYFTKLNTSDYETIWKVSTNDFVAMDCQWMYNTHHGIEDREVTSSHNTKCPSDRLPFLFEAFARNRSESFSRNIHNCDCLSCPKKSRGPSHLLVMKRLFALRTNKKTSCSPANSGACVRDSPSVKSRSIKTFRRICPSGQVVPRLKEFGRIEDVILGWQNGMVKSRGRQI